MPGVPQRARPDAARRTVHLRPVQRLADLRQVGHGVAGDAPVHQVRRMNDRHAGRELERGGDGVVIVADADVEPVKPKGN